MLNVMCRENNCNRAFFTLWMTTVEVSLSVCYFLEVLYQSIHDFLETYWFLKTLGILSGLPFIYFAFLNAHNAQVYFEKAQSPPEERI